MKIQARIIGTPGLMLCALTLACSSGTTVSPPPEIRDELLDPQVAALLQAKRQEVLDNPRDAGVRNQLGLAFEANSVNAAALETYRQATELAPDEAPYHYHVARMLAAEGEIPRALESIERVVELAPEYAPAHWRQGEWLLEAGDADTAERAFRTAVTHDAGSLAARVGLARVYLRTDRPAEAIQLLEELVGKIPSVSYFHHLLSVAYRQAGRLEDSKRESELAQPSSPDWPDPWRDEQQSYKVGYAADFQRALALLAARKFEEAIPHLEELRKQRPTDVTLLSNLGAAYVDSGRIEKGLATLSTALELSPGHYGSHLNISAAYEAQGRLDLAIEHVERAIASNPSLGAAHEKRGVLLARTRRYDEALEAFALARRYGARGPGNLIWSARILAQLGRKDEAIETLESAVATAPRLIAAYLDLARIQAGTGQLTAARATLDRAESVQPGHPQVAALRQRLATLEED